MRWSPAENAHVGRFGWEIYMRRLTQTTPGWKPAELKR